MVHLWALILLFQCTTQSPIPEALIRTCQTESTAADLSNGLGPPINHCQALRRHTKRHIPNASEAASMAQGEDCTICLEPLVATTALAPPPKKPKGLWKKVARVLTKSKPEVELRPEDLYVWNGCGHSFHPACIQGLRDAHPDNPIICPVCRTRETGDPDRPLTTPPSSPPTPAQTSRNLITAPSHIPRVGSTFLEEWEDYSHLLENPEAYNAAPRSHPPSSSTGDDEGWEYYGHLLGAPGDPGYQVYAPVRHNHKGPSNLLGAIFSGVNIRIPTEYKSEIVNALKLSRTTSLIKSVLTPQSRTCSCHRQGY